MTYSNYLIRKTPTSSYFFRIKIPQDLRDFFSGRNEFKISLKNGIHSQSLKYSNLLFIEVQSIFCLIRMGSISKITIEEIQNILKDKVERTLVHSQHTVTDTNTFVETQVKSKIREINEEDRVLRTQVEQDYDGVLEHIEGEIESVLKRKDLTIDRKSLEFKQLRKQFLELRLVRNNWKKELLEDTGKTIDDFRNEIYKKFNIKDEPNRLQELVSDSIETESIKKGVPSKDDSPKISEVKEEFIRERLLSGFSPKSTREIKSTIDDLIEIIGDKQISQITPRNSRDFKNTISKLPKHRTQTPRYRDLSIKQILELKGVEGQEPKNINKLIYRIRIFFKWLKNNYREYVPENHFEGITVEIKKIYRPRDGFTPEDLKKIFDTTNYLNNTVRDDRNKIKLSKYFIPILGIYTGCRLEEISQLLLEDIYKDGKYDVIRIRVSDDTQLKNIQSERIIPIHPTIKELGFLDYCDYLRKQNKDRVFYELNKGRDGYGRNIGRFFTGYLKKIGVYKFQSKVFHSLRHTFITNLLQNGVREEVVNGLDGHKQKTMSTTVYFKGGFPPEILFKEGISKINYEGINFGKLKIDWKKYLESSVPNSYKYIQY